MKKKLIVILIALVLSTTLLAALYQELMRYGDQPTERGRSKGFLIVISPGEGFQTITRRLAEAGAIQSPFKFKLFARIKGYDKKIKAGEYDLSASLSPGKIFDILVNGRVYLHKLTIPEGYTVRQIASAIDKAGLVTESNFLQAAEDASLARKENIDAATFEGYLFPETYYFPRNVASDKIISTMVRRFRSVFTPKWEKRSVELGFSIHQVVTLASIIEKETGTPDERPLISSVFHNRLKKRMRLESDPTVIYGISDFKGNLTRKHLKDRTPYNTYQIRGLPPGPIASPGRESIEAVLYPADTQYLYFVSKKDKTHQFSTNIEAHNRAVRKYQLGK